MFARDDGGVDGYCYSCNTYVRHPFGEERSYEDIPKKERTGLTPEEVQERIAFIQTLGAVNLPDRKLGKKALDYYEIKIGFSEEDGKTVAFHHYPYKLDGHLKSYKTRLVEGKRIWSTGDQSDVDLFGWEQAVQSGADRLIITEGECFTPDTEVLTKSGWVTLENYKGGSVLTANADGTGSFAKPLGVVDKQFSGELVEWKSGTYYSLTTPNHNMVRIDNKTGEWFKCTADTTNKKHMNIPRCVSSLSSGFSSKVCSDALLRAKVMVSADFTLRNKGDLYAVFTKPRKAERCCLLLDELGVRYRYTKKDGKHSFFVHRGHNLEVSKLFDFEDLSLVNSRVMLEELVHWDGNVVPNRAQFEYSSKEKHNADFVQALAHSLGYTSTIMPRSNKFGSWYKVSVLLNKTTSSTQKGCSNVPYSGRVMCLTVPSGMLVVRQKGCVSVSGNCDAPSLKQIIDRYQDEKYKDYAPAVVSLPHGAASAYRDLSRLASKIRKHFKQVDLCFDNDDAGKAATDDAIKVFPDARVITLPEKDANDCLMKGCAKAAFKAIMFKLKKPKNTRLVWGGEVHEAAKKPAEFGLSFPWQGLTDITRGLRFGETYYVAAGEKMGKSEVVNALAAHFIKEHDLPVMVAKPEEANNKTYKMVCSKIGGKVFHDPKIAFDEEAYEAAGAIVRDKLCMLNLYQHIGWETLKLDITAAAAAGVKVVMIDPITNLTNGMSNSDIDSHLKGVAQEAAAMAMDLDIAIFFFCHLNKPPKGATPWDRGGKITTDYFAGSSAMARSCNYAMGLEGNKDPELTVEERNMRKLVVLADREFGEGGTVDLYWNKNTHLFTEA